ncbi:MAG: AbrB/MazE/SpoVT family DNA-binding domain-containing protein [Rickettsia endosymbiont of Culicoides impunctatus]|uniref:AbrB/MazE/SpoVT family DNA-binding domain-containing protein n=1 Tax=unclassified Candidatus Tisiphia TaxID=2996318 RepID=UPI001E72351A|nr:AbrB/MazE/SpoVT family DNA-binding domain-containing protein [Rickettsia endosymbiont of Platyusa sonomae]UCM85350.1 MAG: AbrB/MazE/SpoVT family DNA-binding domain-containing protein [Rickettsia endosymbiont of Culicoides impunctatus]
MTALKSYIDSNGRLAIPAKIRKKLQLKAGDEVSIKYKGFELIVSTFHANIERVRNILSKYKDIDLQKELEIMRSEDVNRF